MREVDVLILGSGPAGNTAAIYLGRAGLKPVVLAGLANPGGSLMNTTDIENFPGFPGGINGSELIAKQQEQAESFGAVYEFDEADSVDFSKERKVIKTQMGEEYLARAIIIATGALYRQLGVEGENHFAGKGVSYCATCDGFFFKDKKVAVVGGGDSAMEEAIYLANLASEVTLIHRRDDFRASKIMVDRAKNHAKIDIRTNTTVEEICGITKVEELKLKSTVDGTIEDFTVDAVFVAVGSVPQTKFLVDQLELDAGGYIVLKGGATKTSVEGVFTAGDVMDPDYRQAIVAAGSGAKAAIEAEKYINE
ncbi:thioredoxin reductase [Actinomycetota bacterium]|nr:thioredoxin reductase [Actinomycetota bacterium]